MHKQSKDSRIQGTYVKTLVQASRATYNGCAASSSPSPPEILVSRTTGVSGSRASAGQRQGSGIRGQPSAPCESRAGCVQPQSRFRQWWQFQFGGGFGGRLGFEPCRMMRLAFLADVHPKHRHRCRRISPTAIHEAIEGGREALVDPAWLFGGIPVPSAGSNPIQLDHLEASQPYRNHQCTNDQGIYIYCICMCMCICNCACIYGNYNIRMMSTYMVYKESWKECQVCVCVPIHSFRSKDRDEKSEQEFEKQDRTRTPVFSLGGLWGRSAAGARRRIPTTSMAVHGCSLTLGTSWNPRVADLKKGQCFEPAALAPWAFQPHSQNLMKT